MVKKIIHIDMDCFYAAVEMRDDKSLRNRPLAVGGDPSSRGVISAANYEARKFGVHSAISSARAKKLCPNLIIVHPNMKKYAEESRKIRAVFLQFTNMVEPLSLDEAYLDVTGSNHLKGSATLIASEIRKLILKETGLTASAGIAPNKFLAKVASDWKKPNGQFVITPDKVDNFIKKLPVEKILGVGKVTAEKMAIIGLKRCGDLQKLSINDLCSHFGSFGIHLYDICRGKDDRPVVTSRERKSLSIEETFSHDLRNYEECKEQLPMLYKRFLKRFERKDLKEQEIKTLFVKVKFSDFKSTTVEHGFNELNQDSFELLLEEGVNRKNLPVRLLGLGARLKSKDKKENSQQLSLELS
tara:strand:- start:19980 stop:21047 length:1068 start_codon:yes stop_codon:yes gene_type:complete